METERPMTIAGKRMSHWSSTRERGMPVDRPDVKPLLKELAKQAEKPPNTKEMRSAA